MSQIIDITLADGQASPVNHTFAVVTAQMGDALPAQWSDKSGGIYNSFKRLTQLVRRSSTAKTTRVSYKIVDPTLSTDGLNTVAYQNLCTIEFVLADASTLANRKDLLAYAKNVLANAIIQDAVWNGSPAY